MWVAYGTGFATVMLHGIPIVHMANLADTVKNAITVFISVGEGMQGRLTEGRAATFKYHFCAIFRWRVDGRIIAFGPRRASIAMLARYINVRSHLFVIYVSGMHLVAV
jgi:hypothetical protein